MVLTEELGAGKIGVEGKAPHEGAVDEELKWHGGAPDGSGWKGMARPVSGLALANFHLFDEAVPEPIDVLHRAI
jgi:hypothetical protein